MLFGGGIFALAAIAVWIYCIIDVASTDESEMRNLPKMVWLLLVIFLGAVGGIAWLIAGRPQGKSFQIANDGTPPGARFVPPPDASSAVVNEREEAARLRMWEEQLRRREEELRRREQEQGE